MKPLWQEDFSVQAREDRYVQRREFTKFLVLTSFGMMVGQFWIFAKSLLHRARMFPALAVARAGEIPVGGVKLFHYPNPEDACILIRVAEDRFAAYSQKCTHLSCAVYYSAESRRLLCPCHDGSFSVEDGSVIEGPPPRPLPTVILERRGDELIATRMEPPE
jgi:nitrite reductase/ring-hydroxylating ferredoxin subunit